jgi:hypothetical protein
MPNFGRKVKIVTLHTVTIEIDKFLHSTKEILFSQNFIILQLAVLLEWGCK